MYHKGKTDLPASTGRGRQRMDKYRKHSKHPLRFPCRRGWGACLLLLVGCVTALAQSTGTVSSYSRFGLGILSAQSGGFNKSMGGVGQGIRIGNRINVLNPASYSAIDSLSFIMDVGMSGSFGKMSQSSVSKQVGVNNASFDYVYVGMRLGRKLGLSAGFVPYTDIGYSFSSPETKVTSDANTTLPIANSNYYSGSGGLNEAFIGLGWKAFKDFSVGANVGFLWGNYSHLMVPQFTEGGMSSNSYTSAVKSYDATLKTFKIDIGVQYALRLTAQDWLTLGSTAGIGHKIPQDATLRHYTTKGDSTVYTASSPFDLPYSVSFGAGWRHKNTLLVCADVREEFWSNCRMPVETATDYVPSKDCYDNRTTVAVGAQYTPDPFDKKYWKRVQYRAGMNYSTPYLRINDHTGPMELRMCMGAGLPITNRYNSRSAVNVGVEWLRRSSNTSGMIKEDYFVINLGVTFNERWFLKYKIE